MRMQHTSVTRHFARNFLTWAFLLILLHPNLGAAANLMPLTGATRVAAGSYFSCALMQDATVKCWGYNGGGELGDGTTTSTNYAATSVAGLSAVSSIVAGTHHACALLAGGAVKCWGNNVYGQIGDGTSGPLAFKTTPTAVSGLGTATMLAAGDAHTCALLAAGTVACWGNDSSGQLGNGTLGSYNSIPVMVSGITTAIVITAGFDHNCAVLADRTVKCWGNGGYGQLGNGANSTSSTPVVVTGLSAVTAVWGGDSHTCTLNTAGVIKCWGKDDQGELGDGSDLLTSHNTYVTMSALSSAVQLGTGESFTCALLGDTSVRCWGANSVGEIGTGTTSNDVLAPATVAVIGATSISTHGTHVCALVANGAVECWGNNGNGQLGDASNTSRSGPGNVLTVAATYTVTPSAGPNGTISPSTPQTVVGSASISFTITLNPGYRSNIAGTCNGTLTGSTQTAATFTIAAVTADCTLDVTFVQLAYVVTPSAGVGGSIAPSTPQTVAALSSPVFTVTPTAGYTVQNVTGSCGIANVNGSAYTINPVTANCTVTATFAAVVVPPPIAPAPTLTGWTLLGLVVLLGMFAQLALPRD